MIGDEFDGGLMCCGLPLSDDLGKYGCPNCGGDNYERSNRMAGRKVKPKAHGNTGKRNAAKPNPKTTRLVVRCTPEQYAWRKGKAEAAGMSLPAWILRETE